MYIPFTLSTIYPWLCFPGFYLFMFFFRIFLWFVSASLSIPIIRHMLYDRLDSGLNWMDKYACAYVYADPDTVSDCEPIVLSPDLGAVCIKCWVLLHSRLAHSNHSELILNSHGQTNATLFFSFCLCSPQNFFAISFVSKSRSGSHAPVVENTMFT